MATYTTYELPVVGQVNSANSEPTSISKLDISIDIPSRSSVHPLYELWKRRVRHGRHDRKLSQTYVQETPLVSDTLPTDLGQPLPRQPTNAAGVIAATPVAHENPQTRHGSEPPSFDTQQTRAPVAQVSTDFTNNILAQVEAVESTQQGVEFLPMTSKTVTVESEQSLASPAEFEAQSQQCPTSPPQSRAGTAVEFVPCGRKMYHATKIQPDEALRRKWNTVIITSLKERLKDLHLGQNDISVFKFCMVGQPPDDFKPTILIYCADTRRSEIESDLSRYLKATNFKVNLMVFSDDDSSHKISANQNKIPKWRIRFSSQGCGTPVRPGPGTGSRADISDWDIDSMLGRLARVYLYSRDEARSGTWYNIVTIGGIISIDNSLYGLTVAHSMFRQDDSLAVPNRSFIPCGTIESYSWSGNGHPNNANPSLATDWALVRLSELFWLPNKIGKPQARYGSTNSPHVPSQHDVEHSYDNDEIQPFHQSTDTYMATNIDQPNIEDPTSPCGVITDFIRDHDLADGDVWLICGVSGTRIGYLNSDSALLMYSQVAYDVRIIALEHPLLAGDSGSWVIQNNKVCGIIFARVAGRPWAYMLPIEPILEDIRTAYNQGKNVKISIPGEAEINKIKLINKGNMPAKSLPPKDMQIRPLTTYSDTGTFGASDKRHHIVLPPSNQEPPAPIPDLENLPPPLNNVPNFERKMRHYRIAVWLVTTFLTLFAVAATVVITLNTSIQVSTKVGVSVAVFAAPCLVFIWCIHSKYRKC